MPIQINKRFSIKYEYSKIFKEYFDFFMTSFKVFLHLPFISCIL